MNQKLTGKVLDKSYLTNFSSIIIILITRKDDALVIIRIKE